jgi:hypothetical protein
MEAVSSKICMVACEVAVDVLVLGHDPVVVFVAELVVYDVFAGEDSWVRL